VVSVHVALLDVVPTQPGGLLNDMLVDWGVWGEVGIWKVGCAKSGGFDCPGVDA